MVKSRGRRDVVLIEVVPIIWLVGHPGDDPHPPTKIAARTEEPTSLRQQPAEPRVRILLGVPFCGGKAFVRSRVEIVAGRDISATVTRGCARSFGATWPELDQRGCERLPRTMLATVDSICVQHGV